MKRWYNRKPETMQDWLLLFAVAAALLAAVWYLPAIAAALRVLLGLATPFAGGLALAYVLDIPARWFAIHLFGGRRGPGILLAYLALFGTVAALVGLVVPQLVQSVGSFAAALPGYLENAQALLEAEFFSIGQPVVRLPGKRAGVAGAGAGKLWGGYHQPE